MSEINSIDDRCQGPSGYSCNTCCGREQRNTDCDDCNGPVDIDMYARFTVNGSNGGTFSIGNNNGDHQGCGWTWFNGANSMYTADRPYGSNIGVALGGRENDNGFIGFCGPNDGDCYYLSWAAFGTTSININGSGTRCPLNWLGYYYTSVENCMSDGTTNDYQLAYQYRYHFVSGMSAGTINQANSTQCAGYNPPVLTSSGFTTCFAQRNWQLNNVDIVGANGVSYDPPALNTPGTYNYRVRYGYYTNFSGTITNVYSGARTYTIQSTANNPGAVSVTPTICVGGTASISNVTVATTGTPASTGPNYYFYYRGGPSNIGWQMYNGPTTNSSSTLPTAVTNTVGQWYTARNSQFGCTGQANNATTLDIPINVIADPVAPTITRSPNVGTVCAGQMLTAGTAGGNGGTGVCNNQYRYSTNNGSTWSAWSTTMPSFAAVTGTNIIQSRRDCNGNGCNSNVNSVSWTVVADPVAPTITKSPNEATVCVGATLTVGVSGGNGGTGTCNNEYRYNNGSGWSAWSTSVPTFPAGVGTNTVESRRSCTGGGCNSNTNSVSWSVIADPVAPTITRSPNVATVCTGASLTVNTSGGNGGTGTCNNEYRYNNGSGWSAWSTSVPTFPAGTGTNTVESRRNCTGSGCNSNTTSVSWSVIADPIAPTLTKSPIAATVCEGTTLTVNPTGGSGGNGTCNNEYSYSTNNGSSWTAWSTSVPTFSAVTGTNLVRSRRNCTGEGCNSNENTVSWTVVADPVAPTMTKSPNVTSVCVGATLTVTPAGGSGGTGTCNNEYRYNDGTGWSVWSTTVPVFSALPGIPSTNTVESRRNCSGGGCESNINSVSWTVNADPSPPTIQRNPTDAIVCEGASISISTIAGTGGAGTCSDEYSYSTNNGSSWSSWSVFSSSFNAVEGQPNLYRSRRVCNGDGCDESSYNSVGWTVVIDPVSQSITKSPNVSMVCQGENVSATFTGGSGGTGTVNDVYEYSTNAGVSWTSYTPGTDISTAALNGTNIVQVRTRRTASGLGCNTSDWVTVAWSVQNTPTAGSISGNQTICSGSDPAAFTSGTAGTGDGTISYRWESATSPFSTWATIAGANGATYDAPGPLGATTRYRRITVSTLGGVPCESTPTAHVEVEVVSPASFDTQPSTLEEVCVGGTAPTLTVVPQDGVPPYTYQWFSNVVNSNSGGTNLGSSNGAQTATLTIPTGSASDLYYYCEVSSQGGCEDITSNTGRVVIAPDPTISASGSTTICSGGTADLSSTPGADGVGTCTVQWQSSPDNSTWSNISGATNPTYTTTSLSSTTYYRVIRSCSGNGCDNGTSNVVTVTIVPDPSITAQPTNPDDICEGGTTTSISLSATNGTPSLTYQWQYWNGSTWLNAVDGTPTGAVYSGATTSNAFTVSLPDQGSYTYSCVVSASGSGCDDVRSDDVIVTVVPKPSITSQPTNPNPICEGGTSNDMSLTATGGTPSLTYQWQYWNGSTWSNVVDGTPSGAVYSGATTNNAFNVELSDAGTYQYSCLVSSSGGGCDDVRSDPVFVTVVLDPSISIQPTDPVDICRDGQTNNIPLTATNGTPSLTYQWQYWNGSAWVNTVFDVPSGSFYSGATSSTSFNVTHENVGIYDYSCVVSAAGSGCDDIRSNTITVDVVDLPSITVQPIVNTPDPICEGGTSENMTVTAVGGTPSLIYQWQFFNGSTWVNVSDGNPVGSTYSGANTSNSFNVTHNNSGTYQYACLVSATGSGCGSVRSGAVPVEVVAAPSITSQPTTPDAICVGGTSDDMIVAATGGTPSLDYQWQIFSGGLWVNVADGTPAGSVYSGSQTTTMSVQDISVAGSYSYRAVVSATGAGCDSVFSDIVTLVVNPDISVTTQPISPDAVCVGATSDDISIVVSGGVPSLTYQWQYWNGASWVNAVNGTPTGATYNGVNLSSGFNVLNLNDGSYDYSCLVSSAGDGCEPIRSNTITVEFAPQPSISSQPLASQALCIDGTPTDLSVTATGGAPSLTYQWYDASNSAISGETGSSFTPPTSSVGSESYYVVVSASGDNCSPVTSDLANVTVAAQPMAHTISKNPNVAALCQGTNISATFTGASGGAGTISDEYESSTDGGSNWSAYSPASNINTSVLVGTNVVQIRTRRLASGDNCTTTDWNVATWTVHNPNTVATTTEFTPSVPLCPGEDLTLNTNAVAGLDATINWYTGSSGSGTLVGTGSSITITPIADQTYYAYVTGNSCPSIESNTGLHDVVTVNGNVALYNGDVLGLVERCEIDGWTYYATNATSSQLLFAVRKNGNTVDFQVDLYTNGSLISSLNTSRPGFPHGSYLMRNYWNMSVTSGSITNPIDIKFYYNSSYLDEAVIVRDIEFNSLLPHFSSKSPHPQWFKTNAAAINGIDGFAPSLIAPGIGNNWSFAYDLLTASATGIDNGISYVQFNGLTSLSGGTGGTGFGENNPVLPVELISFTATPTNNSILLNWTTASEINNDRFEISRSIDGVTFTNIGEVLGQGTTNELSNYIYEDVTAFPGVTYYYKLRQVDFDGSFDFSDIVSAKIEAVGFAVGELVPNPTSEQTKIRILSPYESQVTISVFNILGQEMYSKIDNIVVGVNDIEITGLSRFPKGNYLVNINTGIDQITKKLTVIE